MRLPKSVPIKGVDYRCAVVDVMDDAFAGACEQDAKVILISSKQAKSEALATLLHEFLHGVEKEYSLTLGHELIGVLEYELADLFTLLLKEQRRLSSAGRAPKSGRGRRKSRVQIP